MKGRYFTQKKSGGVPLKLFKNSKPCSFIPLEEPLAKRCLGLKLIESELEQAVLLLGMIDTCDQPHQAMALWHTSIMSYARCFSKATGRKIKLEAKHIERIAGNPIDIHRKLMGLRNEYVAHSGVNTIDKAVMVLGLTPESEEKEIENVFYYQISAMSANPGEVTEIVSHCRSLIPIVADLRIKTENKLLDHHRSKDIDQLYDKAYSSEGASDTALCLHYV